MSKAVLKIILPIHNKYSIVNEDEYRQFQGLASVPVVQHKLLQLKARSDDGRRHIAFNAGLQTENNQD